MIERYWFARLRDSDERGAAVARLRAAFPGATVGTPADDSARKWDISLVVRFPDLDAQAAALAAPDIVAALAWLEAHAVVVKTWSFEIAA